MLEWLPDPADRPRYAPLPPGQATTRPADTERTSDTSETPVGSSALVPPGKPGYRLVFADEFEGKTVNPKTWAKKTPWGTRYTTGESQYYDPANTVVRNGQLVITSEKRPENGYDYRSGIITSLNRPKFRYGYFEIRAKAPKGRGIWPAFWLTDDKRYEIDILEMLGQEPNRLHFTLHHVQDGKQHNHKSTRVGPDYSAGYHIYALDWQPKKATWYVDGVEAWSFSDHDVPSKPMWLVLNTTVGGSWSGPPDKTTVFPQEYIVDYVRVYKKL